MEVIAGRGRQGARILGALRIQVRGLLQVRLRQERLRTRGASLDDARFATVDGTILKLEKTLSDQYLKVRGSSALRTGHEYADYLLSFVRCAIESPAKASWRDGHWHEDSEHGSGDTYINGAGEYLSYPMETLFLGTGDSEDTTFLSCVLFSAAGYRSGIAILKDHAMPAVSLDSAASFPLSENLAFGYFETAAGSKPYCCESAFDTAVPAGYYGKDYEAEAEAVREIAVIEPFEG